MFDGAFDAQRSVLKFTTQVTLALRAVVVAQLVERSLLTPEVRSFNLDFGKKIINPKHKRKEKKEAGNGPSFKSNSCY